MESAERRRRTATRIWWTGCTVVAGATWSDQARMAVARWAVMMVSASDTVALAGRGKVADRRGAGVPPRDRARAVAARL